MLDTETIEQLATCKWLDEGRNLLITGATGAGKSYISNALSVAAIRQFKTVKYIELGFFLIISYYNRCKNKKTVLCTQTAGEEDSKKFDRNQVFEYIHIYCN